MVEHKMVETKGSNGVPGLLHMHIPAKQLHAPVLFLHGYKGFAEWGCWALAADHFASAGFPFIRMDFSHNGMVGRDPNGPFDNELFRKNTYSMELSEAQDALERVCEVFGSESSYLIGHSRGGGIAILAASRSEKVKSLVTWAAVSDFGKRFPEGEAHEQWQVTGVHSIQNARTGQVLMHDISFIEDYQEHQEVLDIPSHATILHVPWCIIHCENDPAVSVEEARKLKALNNEATLLEIPGGDHVFGTKHPCSFEIVSEMFKQVIDMTMKHILDSEHPSSDT